MKLELKEGLKLNLSRIQSKIKADSLTAYEVFPESLGWEVLSRHPWFSPSSVQDAAQGFLNYLEFQVNTEKQHRVNKNALFIIHGNYPFEGLAELALLLEKFEVVTVKTHPANQVLLEFLFDFSFDSNLGTLSWKPEPRKRPPVLIYPGAPGPEAEAFAHRFEALFCPKPFHNLNLEYLEGTEPDTYLRLVGRRFFSLFGKSRANSTLLSVRDGSRIPELLASICTGFSPSLHNRYHSHLEYQRMIHHFNGIPFSDSGIAIFPDYQAEQVKELPVIPMVHSDQIDGFQTIRKWDAGQKELCDLETWNWFGEEVLQDCKALELFLQNL